MKPVSCLTTALLFLSLVSSVPAVAQELKPADRYVPVRAYDPSRNAEKDLRAAQAEAKRTGKNVLVEVGGKWCVWCRIMDRYFEEHRDLAQLREKNYVTVVVNFSPENKNQALLSRYPKVPGYPHLFVLDAEGKLLHSQNTSQLEEGRGYNLKRFTAFLEKWAPANGKVAAGSGQ